MPMFLQTAALCLCSVMPLSFNFDVLRQEIAQALYREIGLILQKIVHTCIHINSHINHAYVHTKRTLMLPMLHEIAHI